MRTSNDWLPDWTDPSAYPEPDNASLRQWAWEFLRRNPDYQEDFRRWAAVPGRTWGTPPNNTPLSIWAVCNPAPLAGETANQYKGRLAAVGQRWLITPLFMVLCEKYGLAPPYLPDPRDAEPGFMFSLLTARGPERVEVYDEDDLTLGLVKPMIPRSASEVVVKLDFNGDIDVQLKRLKHVRKLTEERLRSAGIDPPVKHRNQIQKYQTYLRLLDGEHAGASTAELIAEIFPHLKDKDTHDTDYLGSKNVETNLAAARKLRDSDYRYIVLK